MKAPRPRRLLSLTVAVGLVAALLFFAGRPAEPQESNAGELTNPLIWEIGGEPRMIKFKFLGISFHKLSLPEKIFWGKLKTGRDDGPLENAVTNRYYYPQHSGVDDMAVYPYQIPLQPALDAAGMKFHVYWKKPYQVKVKLEGMDMLPPEAQGLVGKAMGTDKMKKYARVIMLPSPKNDGANLQFTRRVGRQALTPIGFFFLGMLKYQTVAVSNDKQRMLDAADQMGGTVTSMIGSANQTFGGVGNSVGNASSQLQNALGIANNLSTPDQIGDLFDSLQGANSNLTFAKDQLSSIKDRVAAGQQGLTSMLGQLQGSLGNQQALAGLVGQLQGSPGVQQALSNLLGQLGGNTGAQGALTSLLSSLQGNGGAQQALSNLLNSLQGNSGAQQALSSLMGQLQGNGGAQQALSSLMNQLQGNGGAQQALSSLMNQLQGNGGAQQALSSLMGQLQGNGGAQQALSSLMNQLQGNGGAQQALSSLMNQLQGNGGIQQALSGMMNQLQGNGGAQQALANLLNQVPGSAAAQQAMSGLMSQLQGNGGAQQAVNNLLGQLQGNGGAQQALANLLGQVQGGAQQSLYSLLGQLQGNGGAQQALSSLLGGLQGNTGAQQALSGLLGQLQGNTGAQQALSSLLGGLQGNTGAQQALSSLLGGLQGNGGAQQALSSLLGGLQGNTGAQQALSSLLGQIGGDGGAQQALSGLLGQLSADPGAQQTLNNLLGQLQSSGGLNEIANLLSGASQQGMSLMNALNQQMASLQNQINQVQGMMGEVNGYLNKLASAPQMLNDIVNQIKSKIPSLQDLTSGLGSLNGQLGSMTSMFNSQAGAMSSVSGLLGGITGQFANTRNSADDMFGAEEELQKSYTVLPTYQVLIMSNQGRDENGRPSWNHVIPFSSPYGDIVGSLGVGGEPMVGFMGLMYYPFLYGIILPPIPNSFALRFLGPVHSRADALLPYAYLSIPLFGGDPSIAFFHGYQLNTPLPQSVFEDDKTTMPANPDNRSKKERMDAIKDVQEVVQAQEDRRMVGPIESTAAGPLAALTTADAFEHAAKAAEETAGTKPLPDTDDPVSKGFKAVVEAETAAGSATRSALRRAAIIAQLSSDFGKRFNYSNFDLPAPPDPPFFGWFYGIDTNSDWRVARADATAMESGLPTLDGTWDPDNPPQDTKDHNYQTIRDQLKALVAAQRLKLRTAGWDARISFARAWEGVLSAAEGEDGARLAYGRTQAAIGLANRSESYLNLIAGIKDAKVRRRYVKMCQAAAHLTSRIADVAEVKAQTAQQAAARGGESGWSARKPFGTMLPALTTSERESATHPTYDELQQTTDTNDPEFRDQGLQNALASGNMLSILDAMARLTNEHVTQLGYPSGPVAILSSREMTHQERLRTVRALALRAAYLAALSTWQSKTRAVAANGLIGTCETTAASIRAHVEQLRQRVMDELKTTDVAPLENWKAYKPAKQDLTPAQQAAVLVTANAKAAAAARKAKVAADAAEAADIAATGAEDRHLQAYAAWVTTAIAAGDYNVMQDYRLAQRSNTSPLTQTEAHLQTASNAIAQLAPFEPSQRMAANAARAVADDLAWKAALAQIEAEEAEEEYDALKRLYGVQDSPSQKKAAGDLAKASNLIYGGDIVNGQKALAPVIDRGFDDYVGRKGILLNQGLRGGLLMTTNMVGDVSRFFGSDAIHKAAETNQVMSDIFPGNDPIGNHARDQGNSLQLPKVNQIADPALAKLSADAKGLGVPAVLNPMGAGGAGKTGLAFATDGSPGATPVPGLYNPNFGTLIASIKAGSGDLTKHQREQKGRDDQAKRLYEFAQSKEQAGDFITALQLYALIDGQFAKNGFGTVAGYYAGLAHGRITALMSDPKIAKLIDDAAEALMRKAKIEEDSKDFQGAIKLYEEVLKSFPTSHHAPVAQARAEALRALLDAGTPDQVATTPSSIPPLAIPGRVTGGSTDDGAALDARLQALFDAAAALEEHRDFVGAIRGFDDLATRYPTHALGLKAKERLDLLLKTQGAMQALDDDARLLMQKAEEAVGHNDLARALELLQQVITDDRLSPVAKDAAKRLEELSKQVAEQKQVVAGDRPMETVLGADATLGEPPVAGSQPAAPKLKPGEKEILTQFATAEGYLRARLYDQAIEVLDRILASDATPNDYRTQAKREKAEIESLR